MYKGGGGSAPDQVSAVRGKVGCQSYHIVLKKDQLCDSTSILSWISTH